MALSSPGIAVSTDPRAAWYAWRSRSSQRDDPLANYEFGLKVGQRLAIERTASWAGLVPLLQDVLEYLVESAIERVADMGDRLQTGKIDSETGEHVVPEVEAVSSPAPLPGDEPDLAAESVAQQRRSQR